MYEAKTGVVVDRGLICEVVAAVYFIGPGYTVVPHVQLPMPLVTDGLGLPVPVLHFFQSIFIPFRLPSSGEDPVDKSGDRPGSIWHVP